MLIQSQTFFQEKKEHFEQQREQHNENYNKKVDLCLRAEAIAKREDWKKATEELLALSRKPWRRPQIVSYVGWYRDHALFELDNGQYARVDLRPELRRADRIPYFEACYRKGNNPLQPKLPPEEIERLRRIWDDCGI